MKDRNDDSNSRGSGASLIGVGGLLLVVAVAAFLVGRSAADGDSGDRSPTGGQSERDGFAVLATQSCPTELAVGQPVVHVARRLDLPLPAGAGSQLGVYASHAGSLLVGPKGWKCRATMGVDGSETIGLTPPDSERPAWFAEDGDAVVTASIIPACAGCIAEMICAFFPQEEVVLAYAGALECPSTPSAERVSHVARSTVLFVDPAGVKGTGSGSGGSLSSLGAVTYGREVGAMRVSCTLPSEIADVCPGIVATTLALRR